MSCPESRSDRPAALTPDCCSPGKQACLRRAGAHNALPQFGYRARPALACIIGARRAWTVEMISSEEIPSR